MKLIFFTLVVLSGYHFYDKNTGMNSTNQIKTLQDVQKKIEYSPVNAAEILTGASDFALKLCEDNYFQEVAGETPSSCKDRLTKFKPLCSDSVFGNKSTKYTNKDTVSSLANRFVKCVST